MDNPLNRRLLTFGLGKRVFAVPLECVVEMAGLERIETIPRSRAVFLGVTAFRGGVLPVLSLPEALGVRGMAPGKLLLVVQVGEDLFGFPVDRTGEIVPWPQGEGLEQVAGEGALLGRFVLRDKRCFILRLEKAFAGLLS
jgi:chemotaxis signal transduction protein